MEKLVEENNDVDNLRDTNENRKIESNWTIAFRRLKKNKLAMISLFILSILIILAVFAPVFTKYERDAIDFTMKQKPPNLQHWLGTDNLGRDMYTRIIYAGRISLSVGIVAVIIQVIIGSFMGSIAGYYGGKIDELIMRLTDIILCFPFLLMCIIAVSILGPSIYNVMLVLGLLGWPRIARIIRGQILTLKQQEFMEATEALGLSDARKIFKHLLPNTVASIIVFATMGMASAILTEAGLSFLGMGVSPPIPSWGNMIQVARDSYIIKHVWWYWIPPGVAIFITVMSLNILGDGLRDALDPKMKK